MNLPEIDSSLLDLFRQEVRGQVDVLNQGLVELERSASPRQVEPLMRAAHSIKGAARLIGVDPAVKLAHVMEDCLVAVQQGTLQLTPNGIDVLLASTDWLGQFGEFAGSGFEEWFKPHQASIGEIIQSLERVLRGEEPGSSSPATNSPTPKAVADSADAALSPANAEPVSWKISVSTAIDPAALEMFRSDTGRGLSALEATVEAWRDRPLSADELAETLATIKGMRGVAMLLRVEPFAKLLSCLEAKVQAVAGEATALAGQTSQTLERTLVLLRHLADAVGEGYEQTAGTLTQEIDGLFLSLTTPETPGPAPANAPTNSINATPANVDLPSEPSRVTPESPPAAPSATPSTSAAPTASLTPDARERPKAAVANAAEPEDAQGRVVRVTAKNLNRLMGLAGESLVEARWLQPFAQSLLNLKREQDRLTDVIDELAKSLSPEQSGEGNKLIHELRTRMSVNREMLGRRIEEFESHARRSDDLNSRLYNEVIASRMRPMSDGVQGYPRMIRDIARQLGKHVNFEIVGETTPVDRDVLEKLDAPLNHILRNAMDHGIESPAERVAMGKPETATLRLEARHSAGMFAITISDDGRGIDLDKLRAKIVDRKLSTQEMVSRMTDAELYEFLFLPGFSTRGEVTELSGRGVGLDVVHTMATSVGGTIRLQSKLGVGTSFHLHLPITLSVIRAVLVDVAGEPYAFPLNRIDRLLRVSHESIGSLEHRQFLRVDGQNVGVVLGTQILRMHERVKPAVSGVESADGAKKDSAGDELFVVLFSNHADQYGLLVDGFLGEQDLVVRPLDHRLGKVPCVSAAAVLDDGSPSLIIDVDDVRRAIERMLESGRLERTDEKGSRLLRHRKKRVLVVDDSITVREVERQLLTSRGYDVTVAVDGVDGWNMVRDGAFDLVISDVDMPHMNGLELTRRIKDDPRLQVIPVVIVSYKDREEDRLRGLEAGANYYLTKSSFHDESLIDAVYTLIGESQSSAG